MTNPADVIRVDMQLADMEDRVGSPMPLHPPLNEVAQKLVLVGRQGNSMLKPVPAAGVAPTWTGRLSSPSESTHNGPRRYLEKRTQNLVYEFIDLAVDDQRVAKRRWVKFGNKWGYLGLCDKHGLPFTHPNPSAAAAKALSSYSICVMKRTAAGEKPSGGENNGMIVPPAGSLPTRSHANA